MSKNSYVVSEYIRYNSYNTETYPVHLYFDEEKRAFYIKDWNDKEQRKKCNVQYE
jgi:hypothetical protein